MGSGYDETVLGFFGPQQTQLAVDRGREALDHLAGQSGERNTRTPANDVSASNCETPKTVFGIDMLGGKANQRLVSDERIRTQNAQMGLDGALHDLARARSLASGDRPKLAQRLSNQ
jgi:hypothetical protein